MLARTDRQKAHPLCLASPPGRDKNIVLHKIMKPALGNKQFQEVFIYTFFSHIYKLCLMDETVTGRNCEFYIFFPHKASEDNLEKISTIYVQPKKAGL